LFRRHRPPQGLDGLGNGPDRRLEGVDLLLRGCPDIGGNVAQTPDHGVELAGHAVEFRHLVQPAEGPPLASGGGDPPGMSLEPPQGTAHVPQDQDQQRCHHHVDDRRSDHLRTLPVRFDQGGRHVIVEREGGDQRPAPPGGLDGRDRDQQLAAGIRCGGDPAEFHHARAGRPDIAQQPRFAKQSPFELQLLEARGRGGGHVEEVGDVVFGRRAEQEPQPHAPGLEELQPLRHRREHVGVRFAQIVRKRLRDGGAVAANAFQHERPALFVGRLKPAVKHRRNHEEKHQDDHELRRDRPGVAGGHRTGSALVHRRPNPAHANGSRSPGNSRSARRTRPCPGTSGECASRSCGHSPCIPLRRCRRRSSRHAPDCRGRDT
jgi:hypothetical protein